MRTPDILAALVALSALVAVGCNVVTIDQWPCPPGGTTLTYENFGGGFFASYCNSCHSAPDGQRNGAPDDETFRTLAEYPRPQGPDLHQRGDDERRDAAGPGRTSAPGARPPRHLAGLRGALTARGARLACFHDLPASTETVETLSRRRPRHMPSGEQR